MPRRVFNGIVVADKCDKTITVRVERLIKHPIYGKFIKRSSKYAVHDELNECKVGDEVSIQECSPISKRKTWVVLKENA